MSVCYTTSMKKLTRLRNQQFKAVMFYKRSKNEKDKKVYMEILNDINREIRALTNKGTNL